MKSIRSITLSALLTIGAFGAVTYTACNKDECKGVICENNGTCVSGVCSCPAGYEGARCQIVSSDKFLGNYTVTESCTLSGGIPAYNATITGSSSNEVIIYLNNFGNLNATITVVGTVSGNSLTISPQTVSGYQITGSGSYAGTEFSGILSVAYTIISSTDSESCNATWEKQ